MEATDSATGGATPPASPDRAPIPAAGGGTCEDDPVQQLELADRAVQVGTAEEAAHHLSAAIRGFTAAGDRRRAAIACSRLGEVHSTLLGNQTVARAWQMRAERLIAPEPACVEQGWVAIAPVGCDIDDPAELLARAERALDLARRFGDVNLETKAMADAGLAHVQAGRLAEGMAMLDEAMALACGLADDAEAAGKSVCSFFTACSYVADFDRVHSWIDTLRRRGLVGTSPGVPLFLSNHCDSVQATALCELGRWSEAEALLERSIADYESGMRAPSWHAVIALADLRIRQGRLAEAEMLLLGKDGAIHALLPSARLHLARGDLALARAAASRGLRAVRDDRLRAAELLALLVEVETRSGDLAAAREACADLVRRAAGLDVPCLRVRVGTAEARLLAATGDVAAAITTVENALDALPPAGVPLLHATLLVDLVRYHERASNAAAARVEAARAAALLGGLDVVVQPDDAALLERHGAGVAACRPTAASRTSATLVPRERGWTVSCGGSLARLPDSKGLRYLVDLLRHPGQERHALDLVDRVEGTPPDGPVPDRRRLGDAGEVVDAQARTAYRHRIEELRAEVDTALALGSETRAEELQAELDQLVAHLAAAFGLGGRSRRASSASERARVNVTRALRAAIARIGEVLPDAAAVLDDRVRTGLYCAYEPREDDPVHWSFGRD